MENTTKNHNNTLQSKMGQGANDRMLQEFFGEEIKDIYYAEKHIVSVLPKMIDAATSKDLKQAFQKHLSETKIQVERLENVFELIGKSPFARKCNAIEGLTKEGESIIEETDEGSVTRDVGLILAAQKVEHYEIATYGGLAQLANTLGFDEVAELLNATLEEEREADHLLSNIAKNDVNYSAASKN